MECAAIYIEHRPIRADEKRENYHNVPLFSENRKQIRQKSHDGGTKKRLGKVIVWFGYNVHYQNKKFNQKFHILY